MVRDKERFIYRQIAMGFRLVYLHLTMTLSKGRGQDHAHLDREYLGNCDRSGKITNAIK